VFPTGVDTVRIMPYRRTGPASHSGLSYQIAYTWSKSMDNGSTTFTDSESSNTAGQSYAFCLSCNRAVSDFTSLTTS